MRALESRVERLYFKSSYILGRIKSDPPHLHTKLYKQRDTSNETSLTEGEIETNGRPGSIQDGTLTPWLMGGGTPNLGV